MDLVDHYLDTVRPMLPRDQRQDIAEELADAINHRIEDREAELGRRLKDAEVEAVLHDFGHPWLVAARYQPQRHLIGPTVFPLWWLGVRVMAAVVLVSILVRAVLIFAYAPPPAMARDLLGLWPALWSALLFMVGMVTVIAAVAERVPLAWRVRDLPHIDWPASKPKPEVAGWQRAVLVAMSALALVLWVLAPWLIAFAPPEAQPANWAARTGMAVADPWQRLIYFGMIGLAAGGLGRQLALWKGGANALLTARLAETAVSFAIGVAVFFVGPVLLISPAIIDRDLAEIAALVNRFVPLATAVSILASLVKAGWSIWMWRKNRG